MFLNAIPSKVNIIIHFFPTQLRPPIHPCFPCSKTQGNNPIATGHENKMSSSGRHLTLTEELEKLEQSITLTLQGMYASGHPPSPTPPTPIPAPIPVPPAPIPPKPKPSAPASPAPPIDMLSLNIAWPAAIVVVGAGGGMMEVVDEEEEDEGTGPTTPSASSPAIPEMELGPGGGNWGKG